MNNSILHRLLFASCGLLLATLAQAQVSPAGCRFLGNIIGRHTPRDFAQHWNQVTPENAGKWGLVEATRDAMQWGQLDSAYQTAKKNNLLFKQHTFVWGQQQPAWLASLPAAEQKHEVESWIRQYAERYPETDFIDVVNEPLHAVPAYAPALGGNGATGWDWVIWAFEKARLYCPTAKLILNDYNIINSDEATARYLEIIRLLQARNLIDGIGEQGHFYEAVPLATLKANLDKLHATGLPVYISEYDVDLAGDTEQQQKFQEQLPMFWTHPAVRGITLWGYRQGEIWRKNAYLVRSDGTERPAFTWLQAYVRASPGGSPCPPAPKTKAVNPPDRP